MKNEKPKMYIVRKYIKAVNVKQALKKEPLVPVHDCWVDDSWKEKSLADAIGFDDGERVEEEDDDV